MRFAVPSSDPRLHALVVALDDPRVPIAQTWRSVGAAACEFGMRRPGYHAIRVLVKSVRAARASARATAKAALAVLASFPSPYVADIRRALENLVEAHVREQLVLEQHKPP